MLELHQYTIQYKKRNNSQLFSDFKKYNIHKIQNYNPLYTQFFSLNETNFNHINLIFQVVTFFAI